MIIADNRITEHSVKEFEKGFYQMSNAYKTDKTIEGIKCEVAACNFHTPEDKCCASSIRVGTKQSASKHETDCETFCCKDKCDCK